MEKLCRGQTLSASEIREIEEFESVARKPKKLTKNKKPKTTPREMSPVELARHQRHLDLLGKLKKGKGLTPREQRELDRYENNRESPAAYDDREYQAALMRKRRAAARVVEIPEPKDLNRREKCLADPERFCRTYWPHIFYNPFARSQKAIIQAIVDRIGVGGNSAEAVPRGDGKTNITICVGGVWGPCKGLVSYLVILCGNGGLSAGELKDMKGMYECSPEFAADFPEVCVPILALEGSSQRARTQTAKVRGSPYESERTRIEWETDTIVLPTVRMPDGSYSKTSGVIVVAKGADAAVRGLVRSGRRPDLVIGDDLETRESAYSQKQIDDRKRLLQQDIMGLSGPNRPMPILILGSIITSGCLMDQLTDRSINPAWGGMRVKRITEWPRRMDLWEKYFELRKIDQRNDDKTGRTAHQFYLDHREAMDEGAETSNPYRIKGIRLPDGSMLEESAIQSAMNDLCDMGQEEFDAEHQASPHKDEREEGGNLEPIQVMRKINQVPKGFIPPGVEAVTIGIDVGARQLHWVAVAWRRGLIGNVFDYGTEPVHSPLTANLKDEDQAEAIKKAIFEALVCFRDWESENGWRIQNTDKIRHADLINIDTGYMDSAVYDFLRCGKGRGCYAVAGYGSTQRRSYPKPGTGKYRRIGNNWWAAWKEDKKAWIHHVNSDFWKLHVQTGFMLKAETDGSLSMFGDNPAVHSNFAKQICAERWMEEFVPGKGVRRFFRQEHRHNHYLDCMHYATVGAEMMGLSAAKPARPVQPIPDKQMEISPIRTSY